MVGILNGEPKVYSLEEVKFWVGWPHAACPVMTLLADLPLRILVAAALHRQLLQSMRYYLGLQALLLLDAQALRSGDVERGA